jgi:prepilin-type N-terminal cleavage/methylation domain-containing protein
MKGLVLNNSKWPKTPAPQGVRAGGFTLIELLVTLAMVSIVMAAIGSVYAGLTRSYTTQNVAADVQQTMRAAIDFVVEDIMMAGLDPLETADAEFEAASSVSMRFTSDRNMNGEINDSDFERITYLYEPGNNRLRQCLYEGTVNDWETFIDNVTGLIFLYLDEDGNNLGDPVAAADLDDIRTVVISMTVQEPAGRGGMVERTYTTQVRCRNLGI